MKKTFVSLFTLWSSSDLTSSDISISPTVFEFVVLYSSIWQDSRGSGNLWCIFCSFFVTVLKNNCVFQLQILFSSHFEKRIYYFYSLLLLICVRKRELPFSNYAESESGRPMLISTVRKGTSKTILYCHFPYLYVSGNLWVVEAVPSKMSTLLFFKCSLIILKWILFAYY